MNNAAQAVQQLYKKYRQLVYGDLALLVLSLAAAFYNKYAAFICLAAVVGYHLLLVRPAQNAYIDAYNTENLLRTTAKRLGAAAVEKKTVKTITAKLVHDAALFPFKSGTGTPLFLWELSGRCRNTDITLCDASFAQEFRLTDNGRNRMHFNSGVYIHAVLPKDTGTEFKLLDQNAVPTPMRLSYFRQFSRYTPDQLTDPDFASRFVLYRRTDAEDFTLPGRFMSELKKLMQYTPGYIAVSVCGSCADIFIRGRFLAMPVSVRKAPTEEMLNFDPFPELKYIVDLLSAL